MKQEDKDLLLKDLCARLPYEVKVHIKGEYKTPRKVYTVYKEDETITYFKGLVCFEEDIENIKPYLRPMSSMTEEESKEYKHLVAFSGNPEGSANFVDWLNKKMFDYHTDNEGKTMIEKGLAIEAFEGIYEC